MKKVSQIRENASKTMQWAMSILFVGAAIVSAVTTFYVSPTGNGDGTTATTPGSLSSVQSKVRTATVGMTDNIIVMLRGGTYTLTSTLTLTAQDGGTGGHNVIYQNYPGEVPVISGGQKITGWTLADAAKNIYSVNVGTSVDTRQLYVNGVRATRARSVNGSGWSAIATSTIIDNSFNCPASVSTYGNLQNVEVIARSQWCFNRSKISSVNGTVATGSSFRDNSRYGGGVTVDWIENAYELLDAEGEWYLNRATGILYYKPRVTENMSNAEVILAKVNPLISGTNVNYLQFKGITFSHSTWLYPNTNGFNNDEQADKYGTTSSMLMPGDVNFTTSTYIRFESNIFTHLGNTALVFSTGCNHCMAYNNEFRDVSGSGIRIGVVSGNSTATTYNTASNNLIRDCAVEYKGSMGIMVGYTENTLLTHNEIHNMPYTGISMGWGWSNSKLAAKDCEISYNLIDTVMTVLMDGGAIYTLSNQPGTKVHDNYIRKVGNMYGGLYPDEGSSHMHWYNNVVSQSPRFIHMWTGTIQYDTMENNWYDGGDLNLQGTNCIIRNNTLVTNGNWPAAAQAIMRNAGRLSATPVVHSAHQIKSVVSKVIIKSEYFTLDGQMIPKTSDAKIAPHNFYVRRIVFDDKSTMTKVVSGAMIAKQNKLSNYSGL